MLLLNLMNRKEIDSEVPHDHFFVFLDLLSYTCICLFLAIIEVTHLVSGLCFTLKWLRPNRISLCDQVIVVHKGRIKRFAGIITRLNPKNTCLVGSGRSGDLRASILRPVNEKWVTVSGLDVGNLRPGLLLYLGWLFPLPFWWRGEREESTTSGDRKAIEMVSVVRGVLKVINEKGVGGFIKHLREEGYTWVIFSTPSFALHFRPYWIRSHHFYPITDMVTANSRSEALTLDHVTHIRSVLPL